MSIVICSKCSREQKSTESQWTGCPACKYPFGVMYDDDYMLHKTIMPAAFTHNEWESVRSRVTKFCDEFKSEQYQAKIEKLWPEAAIATVLMLAFLATLFCSVIFYS